MDNEDISSSNSNRIARLFSLTAEQSPLQICIRIKIENFEFNFLLAYFEWCDSTVIIHSHLQTEINNFCLQSLNEKTIFFICIAHDLEITINLFSMNFITL